MLRIQLVAGGGIISSDIFPTTVRVDMFLTTCVINLIATTHVETVVLLSKK